jgi:outer membrane protein OmpA-like peptidoglycan-associated protein
MKKRSQMHGWRAITLCLSFLFLNVIGVCSHGRILSSPLQFIKEQEMRHRDSKGPVSLGMVLTINYKPDSIEVDPVYYPLLLELTDVLKTPSRRNYIVTLKGYSDNTGSPEMDLSISRDRVEYLKRLLVDGHYMGPDRIRIEALGSTIPVAPDDTEEGRRLNRRVEIHVFGDVSEAVRFTNKLEEIR